jgi:peptidoglycan/LPS O-acetylase OafA/YrhL
MELTVSAMIGALVVVVVGVALIPVIYTQITAANITDPAVAGIVALIPFFFAIGLLVAILKGVIGG